MQPKRRRKGQNPQHVQASSEHSTPVSGGGDPPQAATEPTAETPIRFLPPQRRLDLPRLPRKDVILQPEARLDHGVPSLLPQAAEAATSHAHQTPWHRFRVVATTMLQGGAALMLGSVLLFQWMLHDPPRIAAAPAPIADLAVQACNHLSCARYPHRRDAALQPDGIDWQWASNPGDDHPELILSGGVWNPHAIAIEARLMPLIFVDRQGQTIALATPADQRFRLEPEAATRWEGRVTFAQGAFPFDDPVRSLSRERLEAAIAGIQLAD